MKRSLVFLASILLTTGCSLNLSFKAGNNNASIDDSHVLKTKVAQSDPHDPQGKTGLLVYGYDNGASLQLNTPLNSTFKASLRPIVNENGTKDLKEFSILFTEETTHEQFAIKVFSYDNYSYVAINYNGQIGGINYFETEWVTKECGFSGLANNEGHYTYLNGSDDIDLLFNPFEMVVQTKLKDNTYYTVWDFKKENNDGRVITNDLHLFNEYSVSIVFDSIATNGCGNLLIYNFAGFDLSSGDIYNDKPIINSHLFTNAIVGQSYEVPVPSVYSSKEGALDPNYVSINVFDSKGNSIDLLNNSFIPSIKGDYYLYYLYSKDGVSSYTYEKLTALNSDEVNVEFSDFYLPVVEGQGKVITIPSVTVATNLGIKSSEFDCYVTIKHNGHVLPEYEKAKTGSSFTFSDIGTYTFIFGSESTSATKEHIVKIDQRLVINGNTDVVYYVGQEFEIPDIEFVKFGRKVSYVATVRDPLGKEINKVPFVITQEGIYMVSYNIAAEIDPIEIKVTAKSLTSSLFDDEDAISDNMITDGSIRGVKLNLKNNKVVTYNKVIDLNKFSFDETLTDKSENQEIIKLYIQPATQGRSDLEALYLQISDINDPTNFLTIRLRYIEQGTFHSGSMLRARANGQSNYVGYYYDFTTTALHVDNAMSHEEGGFITYLNFTHEPCGEKFKDMGLPIYFDYKSGKLFSRPAWLTGHGNYSDVQVPWLAYNFKSDDNTLSGGNIPWKGFTDGKVKISLYGKGISSTANVFVTSIGGETLEKEYITDETSPIINIDKSDFIANGSTGILQTPRAKCGDKYNLFPFTVKDEQSTIKSSLVKVFDPDGNEVNVSDNSFVPQKEGEYKIIYEASDVFNNIAVEEIKVIAYNEYSPLSIYVDSPLPSEIVYGSTITLPTPIYGGGSGNLKLTSKVTTETGNKVTIYNNKITANVPGNKYTVTYLIEDYLGQRKSFSFEINVRLTTDIIFDTNSIVLPNGFINKVSYTFDSYYGVVYDTNYQPTLVPALITCEDANGVKTIGDDLTYIPLCSDEVNKTNVSISFTHGSSYKEFSYMIPISKPVTGSSFISNYFSYKNAIVASRQSDILFASDGSLDMSFEFLKPINSIELLLLMGLDLDKINASIFSITLRDMYNVNEQVKLRFQYRLDPITGFMKLYADINESNEFVNYNIGSSKTLCLEYNSSNYGIKDATGAEIFKVETYMDGTPFEGFSSNYIYFSFEANGIVNGEFEIQMQKINNQGINAIRNDFEKPIIHVDGDIANRVSRGAEIVIPTATASDVLNDVASLTVSVIDPSEKEIVSGYTPDHEERFIASNCGTYIVTYTAIDSKGNKTIKEYYITSYDEVSPELIFNGSIPKEVGVGGSLSLPSYQIIDNEPSTCSVKIFIYNPDGSSLEVKNNAVYFPVRGVYVITYMVTDANDNVRHYVFTVTAK